MSRLVIIILSFSFFSSNSQSLDSILNNILNNNLEIKKSTLDLEINKEKINEFDFIPKTNLSFGYFVQEAETKTGPQRFNISIKQKFFPFGYINNIKNLGISNLEKSNINTSKVKLEIIKIVSNLYYDLYKSEKIKETLIKKQKLIEDFFNIKLSSSEKNKFNYSKIIDLEIELEKIKSKIEECDYNIKVITQKLNYLSDNKLKKIKTDNSLKILDTITGNFLENLEIKTSENNISVINNQFKLTKNKSKIEYGLGLNYINVSKIDNTVIPENGKDIIMPFVFINIPIINNKLNSINKQTNLKLIKEKRKIEDIKNKVQFEISRRLEEIVFLKKQLKRFVLIIDKLKKNKDVYISNSESGKFVYEDIFKIELNILDIDIKKISSTVMIKKLEVEINYYLGKK